MKKRIVLLMLLLLLCFCGIFSYESGRNEGGDPDASGVVAPFSDVRGIGETVILQADEYFPEEIFTYWFNQNTVFEGEQELAEQILENGKEPELGVSELHAKGLTGKGVTVAIIDQPLLIDHPEYARKIEQYHTIGLQKGADASSMHGPWPCCDQPAGGKYDRDSLCSFEIWGQGYWHWDGRSIPH